MNVILLILAGQILFVFTVLLLSCIVVYTRTMKNLIIFSALIVLAAAYPKDLLHAECSVKW